ncbi:mitochondrial substrate carrier family protein [Planoprotostelium fungivorum]|uniref:Mitochondrial substrate carrier family protein n=1 Tax=Planoprotostelium fungivorum TaxID=1890364 RepID=A0A2P6NU62_9EUKA|nr:mitochondrial substrate carrier family protein [Planoprotostelium fungivorum]
MSSDPSWKEGVRDVIAGCFGGVAQCLTGHPLDTIKVRLQTQSQTHPQYKGMVDCFNITVKQDGFAGLYKGVQSPLIGLSFFNAVQFMAYGRIKKLIKSFDVDQQADLTIKQYIVAGSLVGGVISFIECPIDFLKSQLQVPGSQYKGLVDVSRQIASSRGVFPGWFQGLTATLIRDVPANAAYFGVYELVKGELRSEGESLQSMPAWKFLVSGGVGGMAYWTFTFPLDVIKSSIQTDKTIPQERKYKNYVDCATQIYRQQGTKGFFRGFTPCIVRQGLPGKCGLFLGIRECEEKVRSCAQTRRKSSCYFWRTPTSGSFFTTIDSMRGLIVFSLFCVAVFGVSASIDGNYTQSACTCHNFCDAVNGFSKDYTVTLSGTSFRMEEINPRSQPTPVRGRMLGESLLISSPTFCTGRFHKNEISLKCLVDPGVTKCTVDYECTAGSCLGQ